MDMLKEKILHITDNTHDGVLTLKVFRQNGVRFTDEVCKALNSLIADGILVERDTENFSAERPDNTKSKWGEQKNFDERIHLKKNDFLKEVFESHSYHGLRINVFDGINSCICSRGVKSQQEGIEWFNKLYDNTHSYDFVIV